MDDILDSLSKTKRLQYDLLQEIERLQLPPHSRFLSEHEIGERYHLNRTTVRQAIGVLVDKGYIYRINGKGTFISPQTKQAQVLLVSPYGEDTIRKGRYAVAEFFGAVTQYLGDRKLEHLFVAVRPDDFLEVARDLRLVYRKIAGVIFFAEVQPLSQTKELLEKQGIPYMFYGSDMTAATLPGTYSRYTFNQKALVYTALDHLWATGRRHIGVVVDRQFRTYLERYQLYRRWLEDRQIPYEAEGEIVVEFQREGDPEQQYSQFLSQLQAHPPAPGIDAYLCLDDTLGQFFIHSATVLGYPIPARFAVCGISNYPFCPHTVVPLSSVEIPFAADAKKAFAAFLNQIETKGTPFRLESPVRLVSRRSSSPL